MAEPALASRSVPLWRNGSFHMLWIASLCGGFGDRLSMMAVQRIEGFVPGSQESASIAAGTDLFFFLPYIFWGPIAGWMGDKLSRKGVAAGANFLRAIAVLLVVVAIPLTVDGFLAGGNRWMGWALMLGIGACAATFAPVRMAMVPNIVGSDSLQRAVAVVVNIGIIGNLFGTIVYGAVPNLSLRVSAGVAAGAYGLCGLLLLFVSHGQREHDYESAGDEGLSGLPQGLRYLWTHSPIWMLAMLSVLVWGATSVFIPTLAAMSENVYSGGQTTFAQLMASLGVGMLLAGALLGWANTRYGVEVQICAGLLGAGAALLVITFVPWKVGGMAMAMGGGFFAGTILVALQTLLQRITPDFIRSRVFGAMEMLSESSKVATSAGVWLTPDANVWMEKLSIAVGALFLGVGVWVLKRYVRTGPAPSPRLNSLFRLSRFYCDAVHRIKVHGKHRVPSSGPVVLVCNHTAGLDPMLVQAGMRRMVRWMMAREYMVGVLGWFWRQIRPIPVTRGGGDPAALREAIAALGRGEVVGIFPEGRINDERGPLLPLSPGVVLIAKRGGATLVPVHISGTPRTGNPMRSYLRMSRSVVTFGEPFKVPKELDREAALEMIRARLAAVR
jgi:1-acyl-sn-glycerol-3-phosphate acyltransferase